MRPRPAIRAQEAGVTLVEMLVVLALVGVLAGAATLSFGRLGSDGGAQARAETLAARLTVAAQTAAATGRDAALAWAPEGYRFLERTGNDWVTHSEAVLAGPTRFEPPARLRGPGAGEGAVTIRADLRPPEGGPLRLVFEDGRGAAAVTFDGIAARLVAVE